MKSLILTVILAASLQSYAQTSEPMPAAGEPAKTETSAEGAIKAPTHKQKDSVKKATHKKPKHHKKQKHHKTN